MGRELRSECDDYTSTADENVKIVTVSVRGKGSSRSIEAYDRQRRSGGSPAIQANTLKTLSWMLNACEAMRELEREISMPPKVPGIRQRLNALATDRCCSKYFQQFNHDGEQMPSAEMVSHGSLDHRHIAAIAEPSIKGKMERIDSSRLV